MDDNLDNIAKGMLSNSSMKVFDSAFNYKIMAQIAEEASQKLRRKLIFGYSLVSLGVLLSGYISFKILNIDVFKQISSLGAYREWLSANESLVLPLIVLLIAKKLIESKFLKLNFITE